MRKTFLQFDRLDLTPGAERERVRRLIDGILRCCRKSGESLVHPEYARRAERVRPSEVKARLLLFQRTFDFATERRST